MAIVRPNFSEIPAQMIPGDYICKIAGGEVKVSHAGNQYVNWKFETQPEARNVYYSTPIEGRGAGMFLHMLSVLGKDAKTGDEIELDQFIGKSISCRLDIEEYESQGQKKKRFAVKEVSEAMQFEGDLPF